MKTWLNRSLIDSECNLTFLKTLIGRSGNLKLQTKYNQGSRFSNVVGVYPAVVQIVPSGAYRTKEDWAKLKEAA